MRLAIIGIALAFVWVGGVHAREGFVLLNGAPVRGDVVAVRAEGVEVKVGETTRVIPWFAFSAATRLRYDPLYRANLSEAQRGLPPDKWPNQPDGEYTLNVPRPEAVSAGAGPSRAGAGNRPFSFTPLASLPPLPRNSIANVPPAASIKTLSWGLRYGPSEEDAAYFVAVPEGADPLPATLHVWKGRTKRTETISASRRKDGDEIRVVFAEQTFTAEREGIQFTYRVSLSGSTRNPGSLLASIEVEMRRGPLNASFALVGVPSGVLIGDGNIVARDILAPPSVVLELDSSGNQPTLLGSVRMGRLRFVPRNLPSRSLQINVLNDRGIEVLTLTPTLGGDSPSDTHSFSVSASKLAAVARYTARVRMDMGPLLGLLDQRVSLSSAR